MKLYHITIAYFLLLLTFEAFSLSLRTCIATILSENRVWSVGVFANEDDLKISKVINQRRVPNYSISPYGDLSSPMLVKMYIFYGVPYKNVLSRLKELEFWKYRHKLVIINGFDEAIEAYNYFLNNTKKMAYNVALIRTGESLEAMYTYDPFKRELKKHASCHRAFPIYQLNATAFNVSMKENYDAKKSGERYTEIDGNIAHVVSTALNAKGVYYLAHDGLSHGDDKPPFKGMIKDISLGRTNIGFNFRLLTEELHNDLLLKLIEYTYPRMRQDLLVFIPKTQTKAHFRFSNPLYLLLCIYIFSSVFHLYLASFKLRFPHFDVFITTFSIFTSQSVATFTMEKLKRVLIYFWFGSYFFNTWWTTKLASELTLRKSVDEIRTIHDLAFKTKLEIRCTQRFRTYAEKVLDENVLEAFESRFNTSNLADGIAILNEISACLPVAILSRTNVIKHVQEMERVYSKKCFTVLKESLMPAWTVYPITYGSILLPRIDNILARIFEGGLNMHWTDPKKRALNQQEMVPIDFHFLSVAFQFWCGGVLTALVFFLVELLLSKRNNVQKK